MSILREGFSFPAMKKPAKKLRDFSETSRQILDQPKGLAATAAYVLKHYAFCCNELWRRLKGTKVVISDPEQADTKREEEARLAVRAVKRASEGNYDKAIGIYNACSNCSLRC